MRRKHSLSPMRCVRAQAHRCVACVLSVVATHLERQERNLRNCPWGPNYSLYTPRRCKHCVAMRTAISPYNVRRDICMGEMKVIKWRAQYQRRGPSTMNGKDAMMSSKQLSARVCDCFGEGG